MHVTERQQFFTFLQHYAEKYDKNLTPEKLEVWWAHLKKYSIQEAIRAFDFHRKDERKSAIWPTIASIEVLVNKDLGNQGHQHVYSCQMRVFDGQNRSCGKAAMVNMGNRDKTCFVCAEHYEIHREKSDFDREVDRRVEEFENGAKAAGMTNRQYFFHLRGKNVEDVTAKEAQEIENREIMNKIFKTYSEKVAGRPQISP